MPAGISRFVNFSDEQKFNNPSWSSFELEIGMFKKMIFLQKSFQYIYGLRYYLVYHYKLIHKLKFMKVTVVHGGRV